jgi:hypothetical protein
MLALRLFVAAPVMMIQRNEENTTETTSISRG